MLFAECILNIFWKMQPQCVNDRFSYSRYNFVYIFYSSGHITGKCNDYYTAILFPQTAVIHSIIVNDVTPNWQVLETWWKAVAFERNIPWETTKEQQKITLNYIGLGPISPMIFHRNSNLMKVRFCSYQSYSEVIIMTFCTWYNSCAVVACAKFCSDIIAYNRVTLKPIFHWIWIMMEKSFVKRAPGDDFEKAYELLNIKFLKFPPLTKMHTFSCMVKIFCVEFQRLPLKFHLKYFIHTLKKVYFIEHWNLKNTSISGRKFSERLQ